MKKYHFLGNNGIYGRFIDTRMDRSRLRLVTDGIGENHESTHLCPVYYAGSGKGYSGQPEKGDVQYLYFSTKEDRDRYVIGNVDAGSKKMEQLDRQEGDENARAESATESTGAEPSEVKSWSTPGNRRMVLSKGGISFVNSRKGGMNVRSSGIRVWSNGEMTLKSKDIAGEGQKIAADAGDYVWIGSGSSGIAVLPDQIQISAANVYMGSPLSWIHKIDDEESPEALLKKYEDAKASIAPPILTEDSKIITRDGYDDILYSQEMYDFFEENVVGKVPGYERKHDEPYATLFEQWLDETYGRSARGQFWDNIISLDTLQALIGIGGIVFYQLDIANAAIYFLRQKWKESVFSLCSAVIPLAGLKVIKKLAGIGDLAAVLRSDDVVTDLYLIYLADENSMKLLSEISSFSEKTLRSMRYTTSGMGISQDILFKNLLITAKVVDKTGNVVGIIKAGGSNARTFREATQADADLINSLRMKYNAAKKRNVASAKGYIYGERIDLECISGDCTCDNFFNKGNFMPPLPKDYHYIGPVPENICHTEQKIVEYLREQFKHNTYVSGYVEIVSERKFCRNCEALVDMFEKEFPNITVIRVELYK